MAGTKARSGTAGDSPHRAIRALRLGTAVVLCGWLGGLPGCEGPLDRRSSEPAEDRDRDFDRDREVLAMSAAGTVIPRDEEEEAGDADRPAATNADKAFQWRRLAWLDEHGTLDPAAYGHALAQRQAMIAYQEHQRQVNGDRNAGIARFSWRERGPQNIGGRTRSLVIHPTQTNRMWAGAVSGGIWYSQDGGYHWKPVNDSMQNLAIGAMAIAPSNPNIMFAGTGEGVFNGDAIGGVGMYKSTDGGATWSLLPSTAGWSGNCVVSIAVHPTNANIVLVGLRYGGIYRSTNGGTSWSNPYWAQGGYDVNFNPSNPALCVASVIDYNFSTNEWFHRALWSNSTGNTWNVCTGLDYRNDFGWRISLEYARSNSSIVYGSCGDGKIYKSTDGGHSYTAVTTSGSTQNSWYCGLLWVDPTNPNVLVTGGGGLVRSTDGGVTLVPVTSGYIDTIDPHPDIQNAVPDPQFNGVTNKRLYITTDGSTYRTDDIYTAAPGDGWARLDKTYRTTQFYGAAGNGTTGRIYGGTQDNGSQLLDTGSDLATIPFGGDGGFCAVDPGDQNYLYGEYITLQIHRSTNGGASSGYITSGLSDAGTNANFIAPFILDPNTSTRMLGGGKSLWRTNNVKSATPTWTSIKPAGDDVISAIAIAKGNSSVVWIAQNNAKIYKTTNGTAGSPTWTTIDDNSAVNPLPDRYVTRIVIDPASSNTVYIALGGFSPDNLWKTTDGGTTWADITGAGATGLPDAPIRGLARHPSKPGWLYAGTEVGIFASADDGANWSTSNDGPANVSVDELVFMSNSNTLLAATHGRGLFTANIVENPVPPSARADSATILRDTPITLDVLLNDSDDNGEPTTIPSFSATSSGGGTISRSTGTGPAGRDELTYTPAPGYAGIDTFTYTIQDSSLATAVGTATVTVVAPREPDAAHTAPGVLADYYAVGNISSLPNFSTLTPYASEFVDQINYPSTDGTFAGSGRADQVGAVFTGYIQVPALDFYLLFCTSDDGSKLYLGNTLLINNDGSHGMTEKSAQVALKPGLHKVRIEFFENGGACGLTAGIMASKGTRVIIPASMWRRETCIADFDGTGFVDFDDYNAFVTDFEAGSDTADVDASGFVDIEDFTYFVQLFEAGC